MDNIRPLNNHPAGPRERRVLALCGDTQVGLWMLRSLARHGLTVYAICNSARGQAAHSRYCAGAWAITRGPDAPSTVEQIEEIMADGVAEGKTTAEIQAMIIDAGVFDPVRALRIARTITGAGASQGQWLGGKLTGATHKTWSTAGDMNVRDRHRALDGETVQIDERFSNGARYPVDPLLSAADRINCRCGLLFEIRT